MKWLGIVLLVAFVVASVVFQRKADNRNQKVEKGVIKQPLDYLYIGILGIATFVIIALIFIFAQHDVVSGIVILAVTLPYVFLVVYACNWKIVFDENGFSFTNILGRKKSYLWADVTINDTGKGYRVYFGTKKVVAMSFLLANVHEFYECYTQALKL